MNIKRTVAMSVIIIILQTALFVAFILCANAAHLRFPMRDPTAQQELTLFLKMKGIFMGLYSITIHAAAVIAYYFNRSRLLRGLGWLNICTIITLCLSFFSQLVLDYAYLKPVSELIQFSVMLISVNSLYLLLISGSFIRKVMCERPFFRINR